MLYEMASSIRAPQDASALVPLPQISHHDLIAFHNAHFSGGATSGFTSDFLNPEGQASQSQSPNEVEPEFDENDDGLGYYDDGVKRTLTDEQIAMFRHSELETLRRKGEQQPVVTTQAGEEEVEAGEVEDDESGNQDVRFTPTGTSSTGKKKKKSKKAARGRLYEPKPDLRKRTWDVVETGLDTLEYD
ncbi:hypothetical protein ACHAQH_000153 [Verticillium albo-atrum]